MLGLVTVTPSSLITARLPCSSRCKSGRYLPDAQKTKRMLRHYASARGTEEGLIVGVPNSRRQLMLLPLLAPVLASTCSGLSILQASAAEAETLKKKTTNLPIEERESIIARDIKEGQYFVTGNLTRTIYREDCRFKDPTNDTVGIDRYLAAVGILFDPEFSKHELLSIEVSGPNEIVATWQLGGYLKFPWRPRVVPFQGSTKYMFDDQGLVYLHDESWSISPATALLETITPTLGPRQLL